MYLLKCNQRKWLNWLLDQLMSHLFDRKTIKSCRSQTLRIDFGHLCSTVKENITIKLHWFILYPSSSQGSDSFCVVFSGLLAVGMPTSSYINAQQHLFVILKAVLPSIASRRCGWNTRKQHLTKSYCRCKDFSTDFFLFFSFWMDVKMLLTVSPQG